MNFNFSSALTAIVALAFVGCSTSAKHELPVTQGPVSESQAGLGREMAKEVFRRTPLVSDSGALTYVNEIARYVAKAVIPNVKCATASTNADGIYVAVVQSPTDSLYALPGGWIILGNKAIATVQSEDALAGLIAREIVFSLCETGLPKDLASHAADAWAETLAKIPNAPLSKGEVLAADKIALNALFRSGYDLAPYIQYVETAEQLPGKRVSYGKERASVLKVMASKAKGTGSTLSARTSRFQKFKAALGN